MTDSVAGLKSLEEINNALYALYRSEAFQELAELVAKRFVTMGNTIDAKTWREAAKGGSINPKFLKTLKFNLYSNVGVMVDMKTLENAHYIKTLPLNVAEHVTNFIKTETYKGLRSSEIAKELQKKVSNYGKARAELIARTESSKAMTALTEARAKDLGVNWYQWRTADDARVRNSHKHMEGVLVRWNDPPSPEQLAGLKSVGHYNAGNIYNCRCYPSPLVTLNRVHWPAKVYYQGSIQIMTREQFEKIM